MQPLKWDTTSRTAADSVSIYVAPEPHTPNQFESFGSHLQNPPVRPASSQQPSPAPTRERPKDDSYNATRSSSSSKEDNDLQEDRQRPVVEQAAHGDSETSSSDEATSEPVEAEEAPETKPEAAVQDAKQPETSTHLASRKAVAKVSPEDLEKISPPELPRNKATSQQKVTKGGKPKSVPTAAKQKAGEPQNASPEATSDANASPVQSDPKAAESAPEKTQDAHQEPVTEIATPLQTVPIVEPTVIKAAHSLESTSKTTTSDSKKPRSASRKEIAAVDAVAPSGVQPSEKQIHSTVTPTLDITELLNTKTEQATANPNETAATPDVQASTPTSPRLRFAQHLAAKPGERVAKTSPLTEVEQARLVERVARAFRTAEGRGGVISLRLHPPELGALRVELRVQDGAMSARLEAETASARSILIDNAHILRDRLAEQGVRIERFDVDLLDRRPPGDTPTFDQQGPRDQNDRRPTALPITSLESVEPDSPRPVVRPNVDEQLNVIV